MITQRHSSSLKKSLLILSILLAGLMLGGCLIPIEQEDTSIQETSLALAVQVTLNALEDQQQAEQADSDVQSTQIAISVQSTLNAVQPTAQPPTAEPLSATNTPQSAVQPTAEAQPVESEPQIDPGDFEDWMKSADILLYEDMAGIYDTTRFVQEALDTMGLQYVDVKDAVGHFKEQMLSGGPGGEGWDLIISAKEARGLVKGEMYVYMNDAINDGSSVIIEEWELDSIVNGKIATILNRCDVEFQDQWAFDKLDHQLLWPVEGNHSLHHQPNEGIALTNPTGYWPSADLGDFLRLSPGSDTVPLWSARVNVKDTFLTAVSCLDNRVIIQTYSTHSYGKDRIVRMWENYIYNALLARYEMIQE